MKNKTLGIIYRFICRRFPEIYENCHEQPHQNIFDKIKNKRCYIICFKHTALMLFITYADLLTKIFFGWFQKSSDKILAIFDLQLFCTGVMARLDFSRKQRISKPSAYSRGLVQIYNKMQLNMGPVAKILGFVFNHACYCCVVFASVSISLW